jgi:hypothetical protein
VTSCSPRPRRDRRSLKDGPSPHTVMVSWNTSDQSAALAETLSFEGQLEAPIHLMPRTRLGSKFYALDVRRFRSTDLWTPTRPRCLMNRIPLLRRNQRFRGGGRLSPSLDTRRGRLTSQGGALNITSLNRSWRVPRNKSTNLTKAMGLAVVLWDTWRY